jgi:hypothetical protein
VWVCLIVTVVMLVLLDDRIRNVFRDPELGSGEPWLILDADRVIARFLASIWLVSIFLGPAMLSVLVVRMASLEAYSAGSSSHLAPELFVYCALVVVVACCALLSILAISDILRLRRLQKSTPECTPRNEDS